MDTLHSAAAAQKYKAIYLPKDNSYSEIEKYYDVAGPDYEMWSRNFNMHFGYCRSFKDIFFQEKMLENI